MKIGLNLLERIDIQCECELLIEIGVYKINPITKCPHCHHIVEPSEKNFANSPTDCRMICDNCRKFFEASLKIFDQEGVDIGTYSFLCPNQTLYGIKEILRFRKRLGETYLRFKHPKLFFSALYNFGSYEKLRKQLLR